jgi:hypothetical protein
MSVQDPIVGRLAQKVRQLGESRPLTWRACHAIRDMLGADGASITIENSSVARITLCASDETAGWLENLQDVLQEGPCRAAFDSGLPNQTRLDREAAVRWPQFIPAAEKAVGPEGVLWSLPMYSNDMVLGAISLYRRQPGPLAVADGNAQILADAVADMLVNDPMAYAAANDLAQGGGWSARANVHRAAGIVAAQLGTSIADALALLRSYAFATDSRLHEVATDVVESRLDLSHG